MRTLAPHKFLTVLILASSSLFYAAASAVGQAAESSAPESSGSALHPPIVAPLKWKASGVLIEPVSDDTHEIVSVKDPTVVYYNDMWHIYATTANTRG
ncbi:MAG TPA: hypothetical protein VHK01_13870, partial [Lacipirellulaceae bacterium]|nr:hypothetical protein [Lacipirellulaceae bacterium]